MIDLAPPAEAPSLDALMPPAMAARAEDIGVRKARLGGLSLFALAVLAGAFIALGAIFATTVSAGSADVPYGLGRLLVGLAFSLGLILVVVGGAELFTGNTLIVMAWASGKVSTTLLLRNWLIVYAGNLVGALATVAVMFVSGQYAFGHGSVGLAALSIGDAKAGIDFVPAVALGMMCNALVCLAVWLTYSARTTTDRILAIVPPIAAFVASGFEHSVANMYFLAIGLLIKWFAPASFWTSADLDPNAFGGLSIESAVGNLVPVTAGNIVGGALLVGAVYWFVYLRQRPDVATR